LRSVIVVDLAVALLPRPARGVTPVAVTEPMLVDVLYSLADLLVECGVTGRPPGRAPAESRSDR